MTVTEYSNLVRESRVFEHYYRTQKIVPNEEWDKFIECLKTDLPSTFRIVDASPYSESIKELVKNMEKVCISENSEDFPVGEKEKGFLLKEIHWYPKSLAYQIIKSRDKLRRSSGVSKEFHSKLVLMSDGGSILRQEAVSMLPVLFLDVKSTHNVLDMCSAPGSKTSQIIEMFQTENCENNEKKFPDGVIIANDLDTRRAHMLIHHTRHLNSPSLIVTTHSADHFPDLYVEDKPVDEAQNGLDKSKDKETEVKTLKRFYFDRILCDVPCSSDGTLRKNPNLFSKWSASFSVGLHRLQRSILLRALSLLKPEDGILVYCTCSLNPLENEAVVASVISSLETKIKVEILDPGKISDISREVISKTKFGRGLDTWKVPVPRKQVKKEKYKQKKNRKETQDDDPASLKDDEDTVDTATKEFFDNYEQVPFSSRETIFPSMFPPECVKIRAELKKCLRISPHQENTGGFFICAMRTTKINKSDLDIKKFDYQDYKKMKVQDDYLTLSVNPNRDNIMKVLFDPYGIRGYDEDKITNTLLYRNPKGDFNKSCRVKNKIGDNFKSGDNKEEYGELKEDVKEVEDEIRFPRKMWQISNSVKCFLFSIKSKNPLRVIHAGFPGVELSRYRKGPIVLDNEIVDENFPPIYRFNCAYNDYLYLQHKLPLNNTIRCKEFSIKTVVMLLQSLERPSDLEGGKEFHPFRIPRHMLDESEFPDLKGIFDYPGSIIIRLNLDVNIKGEEISKNDSSRSSLINSPKPIFLPAHVGRHHVELLLDKFLRYCVKFHIENIYEKLNKVKS
ncbi:SUN family methylase [Cryptosporidium ryanae]|uniref:SUN family methylase n=1 Tax=Cryptosporidium ryanae TaxID=515981 RepID=UPI00351AAB44|nr:SUN family methylase [Cryptosporidium ryanae]